MCLIILYDVPYERTIIIIDWHTYVGVYAHV